MSFLRIDWPLILKKMEQTLKKDYSLINKRLSTFLQQFKRLSNNHETILKHLVYSVLFLRNLSSRLLKLLLIRTIILTVKFV